MGNIQLMNIHCRHVSTISKKISQKTIERSDKPFDSSAFAVKKFDVSFEDFFFFFFF